MSFVKIGSMKGMFSLQA